jgi:O-antigen/teichoic acid export membrane protein
MGLVLGLAALSLPLVTVVLPEYTPGIPAAQILLAGFFFIAITGSSSNLLLTVNRQSEYVAILAGAIALVVILDITVLSMGLGIEAVAAATAATDMLYAIVLILFTIRKHLPSGSKPFGPMLVKLFLPWVLALLLALAATNIGAEDVVVRVILQLLAFAAVFTPVSLLILRRERIW